MKGFRRPKSTQQRVVKIALVLVLVGCVGLLLPRVYLFVAGVVVTPIHAVSNWVQHSASIVPRFLRDRDSLSAELDRLQAEVVTARSANVVLQRLRYENDALRALYTGSSTPLIPAFVTARPPQLPYDIVQIDAGSIDGVVVGAPVFAGRDQFLGVITRVASGYAFAELMTSPYFVATAYLPQSSVAVTIEGVGGGIARVLVPQEVTLAVGDPVLLPVGDGGVYGAIMYIENDPTQPQQYGYVTPARSLYELSYVAVATQPLLAPSVADLTALAERTYQQMLLIPGAEVWSHGTTSTSTTVSATTTQP